MPVLFGDEVVAVGVCAAGGLVDVCVYELVDAGGDLAEGHVQRSHATDPSTISSFA
jgi:hypothetical protein